MVSELGLNYDVRKPGELTIAQQQMVEIIKAISFNVKILVMETHVLLVRRRSGKTL
jgi:ribose transport system ATP-binding protein